MQSSIKNILVPINFSASASDVIETGIAMCKRHNAVLHLLQVIRQTGFPYPSGKNALLVDLRLKNRQVNQEALELKARRISEVHNINCYYHIIDGPFASTVASIAADFYCDIILLERSPSSLLAKLFKTNSAYEVVERAGCPVLIIPGYCQKIRFDSILFPVTPSQTIVNKLEKSLPIIQKNNSKVTLFGSTSGKNDYFECQLVNNLTILLKSTIALTNDCVETEMNPTRQTAKKIIEKGTEKNADLIVISASIRKGLKYLLTQSYTEKMVNNSPIPVLSVKCELA